MPTVRSRRIRESRSRPGPFFVAGTGRCGTTRLTEILGEHPDVHAFNQETRFIVDPGGLEDLTNALTAAYTPIKADDALRRFIDLMQSKLTGAEESSFGDCDLPREFGSDNYYKALAALWNKLTWYSYNEAVTGRIIGWNGKERGPYCPRSISRVVARYFPDRSTLIGILRAWVDSLFTSTAERYGKCSWCEKTPFNLLSISFLWELFPEATIIHITRHPLLVVASHLHQNWAPHNLSSVLNWLEPIYTRWFRIKADISVDSRFVEIKLEELAGDWQSGRAGLFKRLGLADIQTANGFDLRSVVHRNQQLSSRDERKCRDRLGWAIEALGYK